MGTNYPFTDIFCFGSFLVRYTIESAAIVGVDRWPFNLNSSRDFSILWHSEWAKIYSQTKGFQMILPLTMVLWIIVCCSSDVSVCALSGYTFHGQLQSCRYRSLIQNTIRDAISKNASLPCQYSHLNSNGLSLNIDASLLINYDTNPLELIKKNRSVY